MNWDSKIRKEINSKKRLDVIASKRENRDNLYAFFVFDSKQLFNTDYVTSTFE